MIYLDTSATTSMYPEILYIIKQYSVDDYYNPSALYTKALNVAKDIKVAKRKILDILHGNGNIIFTASGTESDNMAMFGSKKFKGCKVLVSSVEHSAIYACAKKLEASGIQVEFVACDAYGIVDIDDFKAKMSSNVALVSIMHACNETGGVNDIEQLVKIAKSVSPKVVFHSDGVQAVGKMPINLSKLGVDLYTFSAHKFHGMKGVGGLFVKKGVNINPIIWGGGQENGLRSATENVSGIISTAVALEKTYKLLDIEKNKKIIQFIADNLATFIPDLIVNTNFECSLSNILSFALKNTRGEVLVHMLEDKGIIIGTGSACSSSKAHSRIPTALGIPREYFDGMIRISIDNCTTFEQAEIFVKEFKSCYEYLSSVIFNKCYWDLIGCKEKKWKKLLL